VAGTKDTRTAAMQDLERLLAGYGTRKDCEFKTSDPNLPTHVVTLFGDKALCTMVNSEPFVNLDLSPDPKAVCGIDELTYCIMQLLSEDNLLVWCQAVLDNRSLWEKIDQQVDGFVIQGSSQLQALTAAAAKNTDNVISEFRKFFFCDVCEIHSMFFILYCYLSKIF